MLILSVYKPPQISISSANWERFFSQFSGEFFIGVDFNAHNIAWGSPHTCPEGQKLLSNNFVCMNLDLHILNNSSLTRLDTPHSQVSAIDLSISNSSMFAFSGKLSMSRGLVITYQL